MLPGNGRARIPVRNDLGAFARTLDERSGIVMYVAELGGVKACGVWLCGYERRGYFAAAFG
jgi:hypothetical protein